MAANWNGTHIRLLCHVAGGRLLAALPSMAIAQARPGDLFREYRWTNQKGDCAGALRVGGRLDYGGGPIPLAQLESRIHGRDQHQRPARIRS